MKVCIVSSEHSPHGGIGHSLRRQVALLRSRHEVTFIDSPQVSEQLADFAFACEEHQRSAAVLEAIEGAYADGGPDLLEVCDYRGLGVVPLQARSAGHELLRKTTVAVRLSSTSELIALHDAGSAAPGARTVADLEREQFRLADLLFWPGGDILDVYRRYYRNLRLPEAVRVPRPFAAPAVPPEVRRRAPGEPLRILYAGRLQRLKGVLDLVDACLGLPADDWELTLIGADTLTGPFGQSVRLTIEAMTGGDPRIRIEDPLPHEELQRRWSQHHLLVVASTFEVYANVALEAMRAGLPVLATPVGGQTGIVRHGVNGWLSDDIGTVALRRTLGALLEDPEEVERVRTSGKVFESFLELTDPAPFLEAYEALPERPLRQRVSATEREAKEVAPAVTAVVPYFRGHRYVREAVDSLLAQTHDELDVLIVNDGSFEEEDSVLDELAEDPRVKVVNQPNRGDLAARTLGARLAGGEFLMMFDADNVLEPEFVSRALEAFRADPQLTYVTAWMRFIGPDGEDLGGQGYAPLGNRVLRDEDANWDGDTTALLRRRVLVDLDPAYPEQGLIQADWLLYRRLRAQGAFGAVIPERLVRYRVHPESMSRSHSLALHESGWREGRDWRRWTETRWTANA